MTDHVYLSTGCLHGRHDYCQSMTGLSGAKRPGECKFAQEFGCTPCVCPCHGAAAPGGAENVTVRPAGGLTPAPAAREASEALSGAQAGAEPILRTCLYPGCVRQIDVAAALTGRRPARPEWCATGWVTARHGVAPGHICPDHAADLAAHPASWRRGLPAGQCEALCGCGWTSGVRTWQGAARALWEEHLLAGDRGPAPGLRDQVAAAMYAHHYGAPPRGATWQGTRPDYLATATAVLAAIRPALSQGRTAAEEAELKQARMLAADATEYRSLVPEGGGTDLVARRQALPHGTGWSVAVARPGGGRAWTTEGWQDRISTLSVDRLFCWPDPATAISAARRALAEEPGR